MNVAGFVCCRKSGRWWNTAAACVSGLSRQRMWQQGRCTTPLPPPPPPPGTLFPTPWAGGSPGLWDCSCHPCWLSWCCPGTPRAAWLLGGWHHLLQRTQVLGQSLAQHKECQEGISCLWGAVCKVPPKQWLFLLLTQCCFLCGFQNPPWRDTCVLLATGETCTSSCHPWKSTNTWISPEILRSRFLPRACSKDNRRWVD